MSFNESQDKIVHTTDGLIVVDAGPGTGKTYTTTDRYFEIISKPDVSPRDVLVMTFTNNAASELQERIKKKLIKENRIADSKYIMAKTFDSFCRSIVMDSPELVSEFFKFDHTLTRSAKLFDNETINKEYFSRFLDEFLDEKGADYGYWAAIASEDQIDLLKLLEKMMSRGIIPLRKSWFTVDLKKDIFGDPKQVLEFMKSKNIVSRSTTPMMTALKEVRDEAFDCPIQLVAPVDEDVLKAAAEDDRESLVDFIHDVYYEYMACSVRDNRLTFGLIATFAYVLLYDNKSIRERNSFRYLMIDEFQDTNANQFMIAMMVLTEPNLCVVGDWKQGIYGFRNVSIENITDFENRLKFFRNFLNEDGNERVRFKIDNVQNLPLNVNYRSSQKIIDAGYSVLYIPGNDKEKIDKAKLDHDVVRIKAETDILEDVSSIRYVKAQDKNDELVQVVRAINDYMSPGRYTIRDREGNERPVEYGDIAVICRLTKNCRQVMDSCTKSGIPAFLHGNMEIMASREGKLALAWLRWINNDHDKRGIIPIMADLNYSMVDIDQSLKSNTYPAELLNLRRALRDKRRRITELLTSIYRFYGLDNDITQSIITTISTIHRNSLLTISDVIRIISEDIEMSTLYPYDNSLDSAAVSIMTMHKSKGLEYPIVIIPFVDSKVSPNSKPDNNKFICDKFLGIRCTKEGAILNGYNRIFRSWKTKLAKASLPHSYDEERRLLFVSMTRAKQYETLICSNASSFMKGLTETYEGIPDSEPFVVDERKYSVQKPDISGYVKPVLRMGVHDIMDFGESGTKNMSEDSDEVPGKGKEYGTKIHNIAKEMLWHDVDESAYPELPRIRAILDGLKDAKLRAEIPCSLPVEDCDVVLRGQIDLLAVFEDHVEVHDYKTDVSTDFESEYKLQLSVYANIASRFYGKPVDCVIDYVSQDREVRFEPLSMEYISERVKRTISSKNNDI